MGDDLSEAVRLLVAMGLSENTNVGLALPLLEKVRAELDRLRRLSEGPTWRQHPDNLGGVESYVERLQDWFLAVKAERPSADDGEYLSITFEGTTFDDDDGTVHVVATVRTEQAESGI